MGHARGKRGLNIVPNPRYSQAGLGWHLGDSPKMVTVVAAELDPLRCQPNISGTQLQTAGVAKGVRL